jgi:hypothetical protein
MNGKWTQENFNLHHEKNPKIYALFVKFALQVASRRSYYSAKNIFHRIRWETMIEENKNQFKIDDGWISHYARKFVGEYPEHNTLFRFRIGANSYHDGEAGESSE